MKYIRSFYVNLVIYFVHMMTWVLNDVLLHLCNVQGLDPTKPFAYLDGIFDGHRSGGYGDFDKHPIIKSMLDRIKQRTTTLHTSGSIGKIKKVVPGQPAAVDSNSKFDEAIKDLANTSITKEKDVDIYVSPGGDIPSRILEKIEAVNKSKIDLSTREGRDNFRAGLANEYIANESKIIDTCSIPIEVDESFVSEDFKSPRNPRNPRKPDGSLKRPNRRNNKKKPAKKKTTKKQVRSK